MKNLINSKTAKTLFFLSGLVIILSIMNFAFSNSNLSASNDNSKIVFAEESHDFGKIEEGTMLEYSFKFTNEGDKPLVIEKVQSSCGCTGVSTDGKKEYAQGVSGEIKVTTNTQGRSGIQHKQVLVNTNDTESPKIMLNLHFDVNNKSRN
jgi:hypothetical protein